MRTTVVLTVLVSLLTGCGGGGSSTAGAPLPLPRPTQLDATAASVALGSSTDTYVRSGTATFTETVDVGPSAGTALLRITGSFDAARKLWKQTLTATDPEDGKEHQMVFLGSTHAVYMTMPEWPAERRGRWLALTEGEAAELPGFEGGIDLSEGLPDVARALLQATAVSGAADANGVTIHATIPAEAAVGLANLRSGFRKRGIDPLELTGRVPVVISLDAARHPAELRLVRGAFDGVSAGFPAPLDTLAGRFAVTVELTDFGQAVDVQLPTGKQLLLPWGLGT